MRVEVRIHGEEVFSLFSDIMCWQKLRKTEIYCIIHDFYGLRINTDKIKMMKHMCIMVNDK